MKRIKTYNFLNIVMAFAMTMFFSCNRSLEDVKKLGVSENEPIGVAENINLKYTDSGRVTANLKSPKMLDYSNRSFSYMEFPETVDLDLFDEKNQKSNIKADYGIYYQSTGLIDLRGHVVISTASNDTLFAEQLYYDDEREWLFTNKPVTFRQGQSIINGKGFDSDSKFKKALVLEIDGILPVED
ncbi:LPS export ABC transporter periplasmic protein LptC [Mangrovimonas sp. AS39]|uniref:LPS export ABC transporter periplasmic protein LptC n=1 Tax=Mangrovimonas TaxID=1211036 RepID=UPI0006B4A167|nr:MULTISPECIES: LPS export ABC transporter periplasmic protein LptC [Mangrovimonas]MCF1190864.1 LPS export ABC transporter periplasmic protein LptC [Mangrovimonas futianensis]MCF1194560.1 LPS export ABC transporter periplasmic protein LptC [Mangrovimonas futianensis]